MILYSNNNVVKILRQAHRFPELLDSDFLFEFTLPTIIEKKLKWL